MADERRRWIPPWPAAPTRRPPRLAAAASARGSWRPSRACSWAERPNAGVDESVSMANVRHLLDIPVADAEIAASAAARGGDLGPVFPALLARQIVGSAARGGSGRVFLDG